jgi:hypothetical protein
MFPILYSLFLNLSLIFNLQSLLFVESWQLVFSYTPMRHGLWKKMIKDKTITEVKTFNLTCRYIDDVLSINNSLHNIAEILLKLELNTNQSINQLIIQTGFHLHTIGTWQEKRHCFSIWIPINCWKMCPLKLDKYVVDREFQHLRF